MAADPAKEGGFVEAVGAKPHVSMGLGGFGEEDLAGFAGRGSPEFQKGFFI